MTGRIQHRVTLWHQAPSMFTIDARLVYDPADPYAVTIQILAPSRRRDCDGVGGLRYTFARELLVDAVELGHITGQGDVRILPGRDGWLTLDLHPAVEHPPLLLLRDLAADFLADTYAAVPVGTEAARIDWDAELTRVRGGAR